MTTFQRFRTLHGDWEYKNSFLAIYEIISNMRVRQQNTLTSITPKLLITFQGAYLIAQKVEKYLYLNFGHRVVWLYAIVVQHPVPKNEQFLEDKRT